MSQSPLARSTRRSLPAFAHPPSRLSKSTSTKNFRDSPEPLDEESETDSPTPPAINAQSGRSAQSTPTGGRLSKMSSSSSSTQTQSQTQTHTSSVTPRHTHTPSRTYSSPHTPKIVYSPYATSSPHAGPSRSASIPFDMAANAKDARRRSIGRKEVTPEVIDRDGSPAPPAPVVRKGRKGIIRKKPLYKRVLEVPQTLVDRYQYDLPQSIHDILPESHLANPIALALHVVHYLLLAPLFPGHSDLGSVLRTGGKEKGRWERFEDEHTTRGRSILGGWSSAIMTLMMLSLALGNAVYLFSRFKTYDMQLRSSSDPVKSPHASPAPAPRVRKSDEDEEGEEDANVFNPDSAKKNKIDGRRVVRILGRGIWMTAKFLFSATMSAIGKPTEHSHGSSAFGENRMTILRVWEPPAFCLAFFCAFPPTSPLLTYILTSLHPLLTPLIHVSTSFLLSHLATSYAQLVKDRMYLSAEVMREYDQRFVYKKVFSSRVDRGVMTNEAELVW